jgi:hypothetical protein
MHRYFRGGSASNDILEIIEVLKYFKYYFRENNICSLQRGIHTWPRRSNPSGCKSPDMEAKWRHFAPGTSNPVV